MPKFGGSRGPTVLIVGRPNVGKSTLFNRLIGRAAAVVFDRPGVTRDLLEAEIEIGDQTIWLMDSAGWPYPDEDPDLCEKINHKVESTLKSSELILWVVEWPTGRTGAEDAFAQRLHPHRKKTILVINKVDEMDADAVTSAETEFAGLPWETAVPITAKHGRGLSMLLSLLESRMKNIRPTEIEPAGHAKLRLSILGRPNVGKSTLVNRLLKKDRVVVSDRPGTTRDAVETTFEYNGRTLVLVDTAGVRRIEKITDGLERTISRIALQTGQNADVTLLMMDISQGLSEQDLKLLTFLWQKGVTTVATANKWDLVPDRASGPAQDLEKEFRRRAHEAQEVPFVRISAKTGHGLSNLMDSVFTVYEAARKQVRTPVLNKQLHEWTTEMPTGLFRGRPGKMKYAVQTQTGPITFKIFVNDPKFFRPAALRYLEKKFRREFDLTGVPIFLNLVKSK